MIGLSPRHLLTIAGVLIGLGAHPSDHAPRGSIERLQGERAEHANGAATSQLSWASRSSSTADTGRTSTVDASSRHGRRVARQRRPSSRVATDSHDGPIASIPAGRASRRA
jgi:hypothetical protein